MQFAGSKGIRLSERDLVIDGRCMNLWALQRMVLLWNSFDSVRLMIFLRVVGKAAGTRCFVEEQRLTFGLFYLGSSGSTTTSISGLPKVSGFNAVAEMLCTA
jgi:hypothetical protein